MTGEDRSFEQARRPDGPGSLFARAQRNRAVLLGDEPTEPTAGHPADQASGFATEAVSAADSQYQHPPVAPSDPSDQRMDQPAAAAELAVAEELDDVTVHRQRQPRPHSEAAAVNERNRRPPPADGPVGIVEQPYSEPEQVGLPRLIATGLLLFLISGAAGFGTAWFVIHGEVPGRDTIHGVTSSIERFISGNNADPPNDLAVSASAEEPPALLFNGEAIAEEPQSPTPASTPLPTEPVAAVGQPEDEVLTALDTRLTSSQGLSAGTSTAAPEESLADIDKPSPVEDNSPAPVETPALDPPPAEIQTTTFTASEVPELLTVETWEPLTLYTSLSDAEVMAFAGREASALSGVAAAPLEIAVDIETPTSGSPEAGAEGLAIAATDEQPQVDEARIGGPEPAAGPTVAADAANTAVYIHYNPDDPDQFGRALDLADIIAEQRFFVADLRPVEVDITQANVRYFFAQDLAAAERLSDLLRAGAGNVEPFDNLRLINLDHYRPLPQPGTLEVWLSTES